MSRKKLKLDEKELITGSFKRSRVLLWNNLNPDTGIGAIENQPYGVNTETSVSYKLGDFESFLITVIDNISDGHIRAFKISIAELVNQTLTNQVSDDIRDFAPSNTSFGNTEWIRRLTLNENVFTLSNCHADGRDGEQTTNSDRLVPLTIWGYLK